MEIITTQWANDARNIILNTYNTNQWEWSDLANAFVQQRAMMDQTDSSVVHVIVDVTKSQLMPMGGSLMSAARNLKETHPRQGHTVIVGARGLITKVLNIVGNLLGEQRNKLHVVATMGEAYTLLAELISVDHDLGKDIHGEPKKY
jgi:hypothetical protein